MKDTYRELCLEEPGIPLFCRDWWLDAVCGEDNWDVLCAVKNGTITGALPYSLTRAAFGMNRIVMPKLTQHQGLWIRYPENQNPGKRFSYEKDVMDQIIDQLDDLNVAYYNQHFHYSFTNWLPFFRRDFHQTTRYTYVLEDLTDPGKIFASFEGDKRTEIRKAGKLLRIKYDLPAIEFYLIHETALAKSGRKINYSKETLNAIFRKSYARNQGKSFYCQDEQGKIYGALFVVWDENSAYHFISAFDPQYRIHGVGSFLIWEAIKYTASRTRQFDFEGSIVERYERSYRGFGGVQKAYFNIRKTYSPLYLARDGVTQIRKGVKQGIKQIIRGKPGIAAPPS